MNRAYYSFTAQCTSQHMPSSRLKLATLLFDRVYFVRVPLTDDGRVFDDNDCCTVDDNTADRLKDVWRPVTEEAPPFQLTGRRPNQLPWDYAPAELVEGAQLEMSRFPIDGDGWGAQYERYKLATYLLSDLIYWRSYFGTATLLAENHGAAMLAAEGAVWNQRASADWCDVPTPSAAIDRIEWPEILRLRKSSFLKAFRAKHAELAAAKSLDRMVHLYVEALESLVDELKPSTAGEVTKAVLGNLPIPVANPMSLAIGADAVRKSESIKRRFGWVFFLREFASSARPIGPLLHQPKTQ